MPLYPYFRSVLEREPYILFGADRHEIRQPASEDRLKPLHRGDLRRRGFFCLYQTQQEHRYNLAEFDTKHRKPQNVLLRCDFSPAV